MKHAAIFANSSCFFVSVDKWYGMNDSLKRSVGTAGFPAILGRPGLRRSDGKRLDGLTLATCFA